MGVGDGRRGGGGWLLVEKKKEEETEEEVQGGKVGRMRKGRVKSGLLPSSLRIISSCLKTVSSNAGSVASSVRSAGASVAASIAVPAEDEKDQVAIENTYLPFCLLLDGREALWHVDFRVG